MKSIWRKILFLILVVALPAFLLAGKSEALAADISCDANSNGVTITNNTGQAKTVSYNFLAKYCATNSGCWCSGGPISKSDVVIGPYQTIREGFINSRPACNWAWQTDVHVTSPVKCDKAANGCGSEACVLPTCKSITASPNPFTLGQAVRLTCNVTPGTGASNQIRGYAFAWGFGTNDVRGRYPTTGFQPGQTTWSFQPTMSSQVWCGAQTVGGAIVGGYVPACRTNLTLASTPTPTPTVTPPPVAASCTSLSASKVNFYLGETINFTCNVKAGTGSSAIYGYALAWGPNKTAPLGRIPTFPGFGLSNAWPLRPDMGHDYWCGAQTVGGAIVGGANNCTAQTCLVGGRQANYSQSGYGFEITPLTQVINGDNWAKTWKIAGPVGRTVNLTVKTYVCKGRQNGYDICGPGSSILVISTTDHVISATIPASGNTTFEVYDPARCCMLGQSDIKSISVNGNNYPWGSSFFIRWAEADWCPR